MKQLYIDYMLYGLHVLAILIAGGWDHHTMLTILNIMVMIAIVLTFAYSKMPNPVTAHHLRNIDTDEFSVVRMAYFIVGAGMAIGFGFWWTAILIAVYWHRIGTLLMAARSK